MIFKIFWKPVSWAVLISILSIMPTDGIESHLWSFIPHQDKIMHFIFYGIFSFLLIRALLSYFGKNKSDWILALITLLIIVLYGLIIEIIQDRLISSRQGDIMDMFANLAGCVVGIILVLFVPFFRVSSKIKE